MSSVTATMPQTMPSIVNRLRVRLRRSAIQASCTISPATESIDTLATCLVTQGLYRIDPRRLPSRIHCRQHRDSTQQSNGQQRGLPGGQKSCEVLRHRQEVKDSAEAEGNRHPEAPTREDDDHRLDEELHHDVARL